LLGRFQAFIRGVRAPALLVVFTLEVWLIVFVEVCFIFGACGPLGLTPYSGNRGLNGLETACGGNYFILGPGPIPG
jgi:hypothetical protein